MGLIPGTQGICLTLIFSLLQERYKNDLNIAIQLLQCKPSHFVSQKYDNVSWIQSCV